MIAEARKGPGIDSILANLPDKIDVIQKTPPVESWLNGALRDFENFLNSKEPVADAHDTNRAKTFAPEQIDTLLQLAYASINRLEYQIKTGIYVTRLIQKSFRDGYNDFNLHLQYPLLYLGYDLQGQEQNLLRLNIIGDTGPDFCSESKYVHCIITGKVGGASASNSRKSIFSIQGDVDETFGYNSHNCVFKTPRQEVLRRLMRIVPERNQIYFLEEDREVLQRDKGNPPL